MRPTLILLATLLVGCDAIGQFPGSFHKQKFGVGFQHGIGSYGSGYPTVPHFGSHKDHEIIIRKKKPKMLSCAGINGEKDKTYGAVAITFKEHEEKHESSYPNPLFPSLPGQFGPKKIQMKIHAMSVYDGTVAVVSATHGYIGDVCYGHDFGKGLQANKKHANGYGSQSHLFGSSLKDQFLFSQQRAFGQFGSSKFGGGAHGIFPLAGSYGQYNHLSPHAFSHRFSSGKKEKKLPKGVLVLMDLQKYNVKTMVTNVKHFSQLKEIAGHPIYACPYELLGEDYDGHAICKMEKDEISDFCCIPHYDKHERTIYKDKDHIAIKKVITDEYHDDSHH